MDYAEMNFNFSYEPIVNRDGVAIATNMNRIQNEDANQQLLHVLNTGRALNQLFDLVIKSAIDSDRIIFSEKKTLMFVNIQRASLCDVYVLNQIRDLSILLHHLGGNLVVGLINSNQCQHCSRGQQGFSFLKEHDILISANNFNYQSQDLNDYDFKSHPYDFVTLIMPKNKDEMDMLFYFIDSQIVSNSLKVIVEQIEEMHEFKSIDNKSIYGYQGGFLKKNKPKTI